VSELATVVRVRPDTIRYYERVGLLPPPNRTPGGYRLAQVDAEIARLTALRTEMAAMAAALVGGCSPPSPGTWCPSMEGGDPTCSC
jgi:hypothetical protein